MNTKKGFLPYREKGFLLGALLMLSCSSGWAGWQSAMGDRDLSNARSRLRDVVVATRAEAKVASIVANGDSDEEIWKAPEPQSSGPEWIYELFTPPTIYRQRGLGQFVASLPVVKNPVTGRRPPGLDLLEVRPALFRLQLVGFAGEAGSFLGLFENTLTTEHFLAGADQVIPELGLRIERLRVIHGQGRAAGENETIMTTGPVAEALVLDESTGEEVVLTDRERTYHGELAAIIRPHETPDERVTLRKNGEIEHDGIRYRLREVRLAPPAVDLIAESTAEADSDAEAWTLTVVSEGGS